MIYPLIFTTFFVATICFSFLPPEQNDINEEKIDFLPMRMSSLNQSTPSPYTIHMQPNTEYIRRAQETGPNVEFRTHNNKIILFPFLAPIRVINKNTFSANGKAYVLLFDYQTSFQNQLSLAVENEFFNPHFDQSLHSILKGLNRKEITIQI